MTPMNPRVSRLGRPAAVLALSAACFLILPSQTSYAQEGGQPGPEEIQKKIREVEKLMKKAEEALARSTSSRESADQAARRLEELLDEKSREQTGKSSDQLRKEAKEGSAKSAEALKKLTEEARSEAAKAGSAMERLMNSGGGSSREASDGLRKLLEETQKSGKEAGAGIEWLLKNAVSKGSSGGGGGQKPQPPKPEGEEDKPGDEEKPGDPQEEKPQEVAQPPKSDQEAKRKAEFEQWVLKLPDQVRRAYESRDWDAIPVRWRSLMRDWTKKLNDGLEDGRR